MSRIARAFGSGWFPILLSIRTASILILMVIIIGGNRMFEKIDITSIGVPEAYLPFMLVAAIVMGFIGCRGASLYWYRKNANVEEGEKELRWYQFSTVVSLILGIAIGMYGAIPVADAIFIGAGQWVYTAMAGILAALSGICLDYIFRFGIREFLIKAPQVAKELEEAIKKNQ